MSPIVINVATGPYARGQERLGAAVQAQGYAFMKWKNEMPPGSPSHLDIPYAFKSWGIEQAWLAGHGVILWADACIVPVAPLDALFAKIERDGVWISRNGWRNSEWTADEAYPYLFPECFNDNGGSQTPTFDWESARAINETIPHVVATTFGVDLRHPVGRAVFDEYFRLAKTRAFCGPWWNSNCPEYRGRVGAAPCGPQTTRGHRHDQSILSVAAWRAGVQLTDPPAWFAYRGGEVAETVLVADGSY